MQISQISQARNFIKQQKLANKKIVLVPTMGALHQGHLALIKKAKTLGDCVVVSIFVNKTQFNDIADFTKYPRQEKADLAMLEDENIDMVFTPEDEEIFPENLNFQIIPNSISDCLCGAARKGHFDGVALIITKLFNIIKPDLAVFGEKDFQQLCLIKKLVAQFNFDIEVQSLATIREASGLAMSSRNQRLSFEGKKKAANVFKILQETKSEIKKQEKEIDKIIANKLEQLKSLGFDKVDYFEARQEQNLKLITNFDQSIPARIFIALYLEGVRLIDNLNLND